MQTLTCHQEFGAGSMRRCLPRAAVFVALYLAAAAYAQEPSAAAAREPAAGGETLYLFQRVALESSVSTATISIDFTPSAWRVGSPDGPAATEAQLTSVFGRLQHLVVAGRCAGAATGAASRVCAFALGNPNFAGIVNPGFGSEVFGWVATAPATKLSTGNTASTALRYFGLLSPLRYAGRQGPGVIVALRYLNAASMQLPPGLDRGTASLMIHNDRLATQTLRTPAGYEALAQRIAGR